MRAPWRVRARRTTPGAVAAPPFVPLLAPLLAPLLLAVSVAPAAAQEDCEWLAPSGDFTREGNLNRTRVATPHLLCRDGVRIRADSARYYDDTNYYELFGSVLFEDQDRILRSRRAQYFRATGRLQAQQDVRLTRRSDNALITGQNLVFVEGGGAAEDVLTVTGGRPHAVLYTSADTARSGEPPRDPAAGPPVPWDVDADRIEVQGEDRFEASGDVEIERDSLEAYSDRALYDTGEGRLTLFGRARMLDDGYTLVGDTIDALLPDEVVREVEARSRAVLTGEDLDVRAPRIRMLMGDSALERLVAVAGPRTEAPGGDELGGAPPPPPSNAALLQADHPVRPVARAQDFAIVADSVDVTLPGEILDRLMAVGNAHGESTARDSLGVEGLPEVARRDWIDGRTIEAVFSRVDTAAPAPEAGDTARAEYQLESLKAGGAARSLYRMAARDSAAASSPEGTVRPAIHYVVGDTITLTMEAGEIRTMDVVGRVRGVHWEPMRRPGGGGGGVRSGGAPPPVRRSLRRRRPHRAGEGR